MAQVVPPQVWAVRQPAVLLLLGAQRSRHPAGAALLGGTGEGPVPHAQATAQPLEPQHVPDLLGGGTAPSHGEQQRADEAKRCTATQREILHVEGRQSL